MHLRRSSRRWWTRSRRSSSRAALCRTPTSAAKALTVSRCVRTHHVMIRPLVPLSCFLAWKQGCPFGSLSRTFWTPEFTDGMLVPVTPSPPCSSASSWPSRVQCMLLLTLLGSGIAKPLRTVLIDSVGFLCLVSRRCQQCDLMQRAPPFSKSHRHPCPSGNLTQKASCAWQNIDASKVRSCSSTQPSEPQPSMSESPHIAAGACGATAAEGRPPGPERER